mmetsp:Transcript_1984/g.3531  ORF Transcript_1984/g.3531 Transcript_1984/m.3531 type:complete len:227 (+) Transcript_1984:454-1134(+)
MLQEIFQPENQSIMHSSDLVLSRLQTLHFRRCMDSISQENQLASNTHSRKTPRNGMELRRNEFLRMRPPRTIFWSNFRIQVDTIHCQEMSLLRHRAVNFHAICLLHHSRISGSRGCSMYRECHLMQECIRHLLACLCFLTCQDLLIFLQECLFHRRGFQQQHHFRINRRDNERDSRTIKQCPDQTSKTEDKLNYMPMFWKPVIKSGAPPCIGTTPCAVTIPIPYGV